MKKVLLLLLPFCLLTAISEVNPSLAQSPREMTVSAAISLKGPFEEIGKIFEGRHPEIRVRFNFAASGDLARQIEVGAPVDVFASAAQKDMDDVSKKGILLDGTRKDFVSNSVVLVKPVLSHLRVESFDDLKKVEVKKIALGNPKTVPAGRYAEEVLRYLRLWSALKDKLVLAEHAQQALDYVARNEVDAAVVYSSDAVARSQEVGIVMRAPAGSHPPVIYPIAVVQGSKNPSLAKDFVSLVLSTSGRNTLQKCGFQMVK